jgi:hypothetical protein
LTRRDLVDATPLTAKEIQAEKDQLRAQFAVSVRRLELNMEQMRLKATERAADRQNAERARLQVELDRKSALILALRAREEVRKRTFKRVAKLLLYLFARSNRRAKAPQSYVPPPQRVWEFEREPDAGELASTAAAIAAVSLKRRQARAGNFAYCGRCTVPPPRSSYICLSRASAPEVSALPATSSTFSFFTTPSSTSMA